jgi:Holliday junction resolvasome RuvABC endonuclease subunit
MSRILGLDISTKTGWAVCEVSETEIKLIKAATSEKRDRPKDLIYPTDYLVWATLCYQDIVALIQKYQPDELVIEETSKGSKNNFSQKILEFIHLRVAEYITDTGIKATYYMTGEWRGICGCKLTLEEKKRNKEVKTQHGQGTKVVKNAEGKRIGKIGKKHVNIRRANELFNLELIRKDEDRADAILLTYAHFQTHYKKVV